jgi:hypothetical protein
VVLTSYGYVFYLSQIYERFFDISKSLRRNYGGKYKARIWLTGDVVVMGSTDVKRLTDNLGLAFDDVNASSKAFIT